MKWKWILCAVLMAGLLCSCGKKEEPPIQEEPGAVEPVTAGNAEELLAKLTVQEKVGQLFLISPDALDTTQTPQQRQDPNQPGLTQVDASARNVLKDYPVGGFVCTAKQLQDPDQLESLMTRLSQSSRVLPLAIEEEGGSRSPFAGKETFSSPQVADMATVGADGDPAKAKQAGLALGSFLRDLGFHLDLAPVADVKTDPDNAVLGNRSFGAHPEQTAMLVSAAVDGFHEAGVACALKHFPGEGSARWDSQTGRASTEKTWQEMLTCEIYPFQAGMATGADVVLVSHMTAPNAVQDGLPASLSREMITEKLRGELRFQRVILTDSLSAQAITDTYSAGLAALLAFQAGADLLLMPEDLPSFDALLSAVEKGTISQERLDQSVLRILQLKENMTLFDNIPQWFPRWDVIFPNKRQPMSAAAFPTSPWSEAPWAQSSRRSPWSVSISHMGVRTARSSSPLYQ